MKFKAELRCQICHKLLIGIGFGPANLMMKMRGCKHNPQFLPQLQQDPEQRNGIRATGAADGNALSRLEQAQVTDVFKYLFHLDIAAQLPLWNI